MEDTPFDGPEPKTRLELEREILEWKHNHKMEVQRARVLKERLDMPLERVRAYEQIGELQKHLADTLEIHRRDLDIHMELFDLRREIYKIGWDMVREEMDEQDQIAMGNRLVSLSGLCSACDGTGEDGDPDGGTYACISCKGTGSNQCL